MKKLYMLGATLLAGVIISGTAVNTAYAWHPEGQIQKLVQNQTDGGTLSDANDTATAVEAAKGDVLKYVIRISNEGKTDSRGWNDMHYTVLKDTLPEGVELVSDPAKRQIIENIGVVKPGQTVTREYLVRVTSDKDEDLITNKACFTGDSEVKDNRQSGCDNAVVTVDVPQIPDEPAVIEKPVKKGKGDDKPQVLPAVLPATGIGNVAGMFTGFTGLGYIGHRLVTRKRQ